MTRFLRAEIEAEAYKAATEKLVAAIERHYAGVKSLGLNDTRGTLQWGGPYDHALWATLGLPSGPEEEARFAAFAAQIEVDEAAS